MPPTRYCRRMALCCLAFVFLLPAGTARPDSAPAAGQITWDDARQLVEKTLGDEGYNIKGAGFELNEVNDSHFPSFYNFEAFQSVRLRRVKIEYYAVNSVTAEVWKKTACEQAHTPSLEPLQKSLREKY